MKDNIIWNEKYRPTNIYKIMNQNIINLINTDNLENLPHLLLYGPSGSGKTTAALTLCHYLFNNNLKYKNIYNKIMNERMLELNASDERGINTVREKIKIFALQNINKYDNIVSFKIIILDEADAMTNESQCALRRIVEQYTYITRFILICNYVTKIISPLTSRFYKIKFNNFNKDNIMNIMNNIINIEKIDFEDDNKTKILDKIIDISDNDVRKIVILLQRINYIYKITALPINITRLEKIINSLPIKFMDKIYNELFNKISYKILLDLTKDILNNGYVYNIFIKDLSERIMNDKNISNKNKSLIFIKMSDICYNLSNGSDEYIQLISILSYINNLL